MADHPDGQIDDDEPPQPGAGATVGEMVKRLFDHWQLGDDDRAALLGCPAELLDFDDTVAGEELSERVGHLLAIHAKLRKLFPQDRDVAYGWMTLRNRAFADQTPVAVVRDQGLDGLRAVRAYLERAIGV